MLISADTGVPFLSAMRPFIDAVTLLVWAWGTWWIPLLLLLGFWKHVVCRVPLVYTPMLWSLVFPLGMHAIATWNLSLAADLSWLRSIASVSIWVALSVWGATAVALICSSWKSLK